MTSAWRSRLCLMTGLLCLGLAGQFHDPLITLRKDHQLQAVAPEDTTPLVALTTVAFGGFRGLVADVLWVRAGELQEEGDYFELVQLSRWIAQLEPRIPEVWSFQSWNLSYNISVLFPDPEDRWRWVRHGIGLLKKDGLTHNPASPSLHWDIGWIYQHKIGQRYDVAHPLYRQKLAAEIEELLPEGRLPKTPSDTMAAELDRRWAMQLDVMQELDRIYGPLDWRIPETHSLYWSTTGLPLVRSNPIQEEALQRMRTTSLRQLMWTGQLLGTPADGKTTPLPRPDLIAPLLEEFESRLATDNSLKFLRTFEAFLVDAMTLRAELGQIGEARQLYNRLAVLSAGWPEGDEGFNNWLNGLRLQRPEEMAPDHALLRVTGLLLQAAAWEPTYPTRAKGLRSIASQTHRYYQGSLDSESEKDRLGLPGFDLMRSLLEDSAK